MIEREIEVLINFDGDHMNKIEKELLNPRVKVFQAFQPKVSIEENNK
jgi:hypothetical protein